jgi:hypothetical protein
MRSFKEVGMMKRYLGLLLLFLICGCSFVVRDIGNQDVKRYGISQKDTDELLQKTDSAPAEAKREILKIKRY